uniref:BHLH domain-containing protein n=1 Tax=Arundo donax TaxID=35708 RepID=A0A0A9FQM1_ARUDO
MALEAVVFPQEHLACTAKVAVAAHSGSPGCGIDIDEIEDKSGIVLKEEADALALPHGAGVANTWDAALCPCSIAPGAVEECWDVQHHPVSPPPVPPELEPARGKATASASRRPRRRPKAVKNMEEMESQRRNHIAVERNRRRQMNEYLAVLRSVMPPSYAQRGDQASIVAGAINFVKDLEQLLQSLEAQKRSVQRSEPPAAPFAGFFTFPQYSAGASCVAGASDSAGSGGDQSGGGCAARRGVADIEVAVAESHANVKVLAPRRPRQLLRMLVALHCLGLTVLHLNVTTTADHLAFYTFSLKMEDQCRLSSVDDIAADVNEIVAKISDECFSQVS